MRPKLIAVLAALVLLCGPLRAREASEADKAEIQRVIAAQMDAFKRNDGDGALAFAAPNVREKFGDGPHFLDMVRTLYPAVFRPRSVSFGAVAAEGEVTIQHVGLVGPDGAAAVAIYEMVRTPEGLWRIAGCSVFKGAAVET